MRNFDTKADFPGTPNTLSAAEFNDLANENENLVTVSGQSLNQADPNQMGKAVANYVGRGNIFDDVGVADAYIISSSSNSMQLPHAVVDGLRVRFRADNSNTGASTVNVLAVGAHPIVRHDGTALQSGDIVASRMVEIERDQANTRWVLVSQRYDYATETKSGVVTKATQAEVLAGTENTNYVTPLDLQAKINQSVTPRAWAAINGVDGSVFASSGVSTVSKTGTGTYTVTLSSALPDAQGAVFVSGTIAKTSSIDQSGGIFMGWVDTTTTVKLVTADNNLDTNINPTNINVLVYR